jgi:hypothetical protein
MRRDPDDRDWLAVLRMAIAGVLSLVGAALLLAASVFFVFFNYCEDSCDKPAWTFWGAAAAALPWVLGSAACLVAAGRVVVDRGRWGRTIVLAAGGPVAFAAGAAAGLLVSGDSLGAAVLSGLVLFAVWTIVMLRRTRAT